MGRWAPLPSLPMPVRAGPARRGRSRRSPSSLLAGHAAACPGQSGTTSAALAPPAPARRPDRPNAAVPVAADGRAPAGLPADAAAGRRRSPSAPGLPQRARQATAGRSRTSTRRGRAAGRSACSAPTRSPRRSPRSTSTTRRARCTEAWTGFQVAWTMARGYPGAFGRKINAPWVWIPLTILFVAPFFDSRRPLRMLHLDLLVLAAFGGLGGVLQRRPDRDLGPDRLSAARLPAGRALWIGLRTRPPAAGAAAPGPGAGCWRSRVVFLSASGSR